VLGLTWQVIRAGLMDKISVDKHPEMVALMMPGEDVNAFVKLAPGMLCFVFPYIFTLSFGE
jgi:hypothetical protein